jgi:hypothetical protein
MLTKFLAKLMGLWLVLAVLSMMFNEQQTLAAVKAMFADPGLAFVTGVFTLVIGVAVVIGHNRWSGGALPILVTLYGWVALIKGLLFLIFPTDAQTAFFAALHFDRYYFGYLAIALVIGAYLIYGGFKPSANLGRNRFGLPGDTNR